MDAQSALAALNSALPSDEDEPEAPKELIPEGVTYNHPGRRSFPTTKYYPFVEAGRRHQSTFKVTPRHEKLTSGNGVCFNVESVPEPLEEHSQKKGLTRLELVDSLQEEVSNHYNNEREVNSMECSNSDRVKAADVKLEALSEIPSCQTLVHVGSDGFVLALVTAFAQHLPLTLSPDDLWIVICYAFAKHVEENSEELRDNFVQHEGKKRLHVETPGNFGMSNGSPDTGATARDWEALIFPAFSTQIKATIGDKTHAAIAGKFSTTTAAAGAAHEITLMSAMRQYFGYGFATRCGIPNITLLGTEQDWVSLRERAEHLGSLMLPELTDYWMPLLLPILDQFVESYKGNVYHGFWQSMVKLRDTGPGSGSHDFISGWMQILFPYNTDGMLNRNLKPWHEMYFQGPELYDLPPLFSSAPVDWNYMGTTHDLTFHAGLVGFTQDATTGALAPLLGWHVSHVPPRSNALLAKEYQEELQALLLGHKEEDKDKKAPWVERVQFLRSRLAELEGNDE